MNNRLSPVLLLLALAGPVHAQDLGPGQMIQELVSLDEAAQGAGPGRAVPKQREARPVKSPSNFSGRDRISPPSKMPSIATHAAGR